jgi:hypothetical protein
MTRMQERRSEVRLMCADMIRVRWMPSSGKSHRATALLEDISASGACLQMESSVPEGSIVRWSSAGKEFEGHVRYCEYRDIGYFVGIEFREGSKWSARAYEPPHLLDHQDVAEPRRN